MTLDSSDADGLWDLEHRPTIVNLTGSGTTASDDGTSLQRNFTFTAVAPGRETILFSTPGSDLANPPQIATYFVTVTGDATTGTVDLTAPAGTTVTTLAAGPASTSTARR